MDNDAPRGSTAPKEEGPQTDAYFEGLGAGYFKSFQSDPLLFRRYIILRSVLIVLSAAATILCGVTIRTGYVKVIDGDSMYYARIFYSHSSHTKPIDNLSLKPIIVTSLCLQFVSMIFAIIFCAIRVRAEKQRGDDDEERGSLDVFSANTLAYYVQKEAYRRRVDRTIGILFFCLCVLSIIFDVSTLGLISSLRTDWRYNCDNRSCSSTLSAGFALFVVCVALELASGVLLVIPCVCGFSFKKVSYERLLQKAHTDCPVELMPRRNLKIVVSATNVLASNYSAGNELDVIVGRIGATTVARDHDGGGGHVGMTPAAYFNAPAQDQRGPNDGGARALDHSGRALADGHTKMPEAAAQVGKGKMLEDDGPAFKEPPFFDSEATTTVEKKAAKTVETVPTVSAPTVEESVAVNGKPITVATKKNLN